MMICGWRCFDTLRPMEALQVWDFDWTLVEENSDTWVLQQLGATATFERLLAQVRLRPFLEMLR